MATQTISGRFPQITPGLGLSFTYTVLNTRFMGGVNPASVARFYGCMICAQVPPAVLPELGHTYTLLSWTASGFLMAGPGLSPGGQCVWGAPPVITVGVSKEAFTATEQAYWSASSFAAPATGPPPSMVDQATIYDGSQDVMLTTNLNPGVQLPNPPNLHVASSFPVPVAVRSGDAITVWLYVRPFTPGPSFGSGGIQNGPIYVIAWMSYSVTYDDGRG